MPRSAAVRPARLEAWRQALCLWPRPRRDGGDELRHATIIAYAHDFKLLMYLTLATIPLVFVIGGTRQAQGAPREASAPAH
jgi:hypothetical protein